MGDRRLVVQFPDAKIPDGFTSDWLDAQIKHYLEDEGTAPEQTFFNMDCYSNPIGIEIEAESFKGFEHGTYFWHVEEDLSLKKQGVEFISYPLMRGAIDYALEEIRPLCEKLTFGHRTSVHIHCNVSHYTNYQICTLMAYYAMLEKLFYSLVDFQRHGNSFCYPLVGTPPEAAWYAGMEGELEKTTKYCAFNIAPARNQLSVEFRHMHGNADPKTLRRWIQLCAKLVYYVGNIPPKMCIEETIELIKSGEFFERVREVWGDTTDIFEERHIRASIKHGELWALTLLTGLA